MAAVVSRSVRRLVLDDFDIGVFIQFKVAGIDQLLHFSFCHLGRSIGKSLENFKAAATDHDRKGLCEQEVSDQDTGLVPPDCVGGILAAPGRVRGGVGRPGKEPLSAIWNS